MSQGVQVTGKIHPGFESILTPDALTFLGELHRRFNYTRLSLLRARMVRQKKLDAGSPIDFHPLTQKVREDPSWKVADVPADLQKRWVEITGPTSRKMMINALNSGADVFMADLEDSTSPNWFNVIDGQINLRDSANGSITFKNKDGSLRKLKPKAERATLLLRPRGWHLDEKHILVDGQPISGSLVDFGLYFFHNAKALLASESGPYYYLAKLESHQEARLWNDVFRFSQDYLNLPQKVIKVTVLIETIFGCIEMEEILYELREHIVGLNAGRWDYIFSIIKRLWKRMAALPDRGKVGMTVPFMRAYTEKLVQTCHKRGAHCIGGMSAFIPNRRDPEVTKAALAKIQQGKRREVADGVDGTWVAHPDLVSHVRSIFQERLLGAPHQKHRLREDVTTTVEQLIDTTVSPSLGGVTEKGVRINIVAALHYIDAWLRGIGAVGLNNLMEDAATAEISRAQLWQWRMRQTTLEDGRVFDAKLYRTLKAEELSKIKKEKGSSNLGRIEEASTLLDKLVLTDQFIEFLTLPAYEIQDARSGL